MISLDTSVLIDLLREARAGTAGPATRRLGQHGSDVVCVSVFALCEIEAGLARSSRRAEETPHVQALIERFEVVHPDERFPPLYGRVLAELLDRGRPPGAMDLLIAVSAMVAGTPLLTRDARGFLGIPGLRLEPYEPEGVPRRRKPR